MENRKKKNWGKERAQRKKKENQNNNDLKFSDFIC